MSWGLRVLSASGAEELDITDEITRVLYVGSHGPSGTITLPDFNMDDGFACLTCTVPYATYYYTFDAVTKEFTWSVSDSSNCTILVVMLR